MASNKVVVCGAGFLGMVRFKVTLGNENDHRLGSHFARAIASSTRSNFQVQVSSRRPERVYDSILRESPELVESGRLLPPFPVDITRPDTLTEAFKNASTVISLVGLMHGSPEDFDRIQHRGAQNVARAAQEVDAKLIHFSAIGADINSDIPYYKTKGLGEEAGLVENPKSTIVRPSLVFGPGDGFFSVCDCASRMVVGSDTNPDTEIRYNVIFHAIPASFCWRHHQIPARLCWGPGQSCRSYIRR